MTSLLARLFIKDRDNLNNPNVKKAYATLSSIVGIILNVLLCMAKIVIGLLCKSVAIMADGFNNLADAGTSLISFISFKMSKYGGGLKHPFGHGRIEWVMSIFTSLAVVIMGVKLAETSIDSIKNPQETVFGIALFVVLVLSIAVKIYMFCYNRKFAKITGSESLKATATDCISDSVATLAVLISAIVGFFTNLNIDGYCGIVVSIFIIFVGVKSLLEVLGRIMGKAADKELRDNILQLVDLHKGIVAVHNLMIHDYGFGYFIVSMRIEGYKENAEQLYETVNAISYDLYKKYRCESCIQIDYILKDDVVEQNLTEQVYTVLKKYSPNLKIDGLRLIENGSFTIAAFNMYYPPNLQSKQEAICDDIVQTIESANENYRVTVKSVLARLSYIKNNFKEDI